MATKKKAKKKTTTKKRKKVVEDSVSSKENALETKSAQKAHKATYIALTQKQIGLLQGLAYIGVTQKDAAIELGISLATLERRLVDQEGVAEAWYTGKTKRKIKFYKTGFDIAVQDKNDRMLRFFLSSEYGLREREPRQTNVNLVNQVSTGADPKGEVIDVTPKQRFIEHLANLSEEQLEEMAKRKTPIIDS